MTSRTLAPDDLVRRCDPQSLGLDAAVPSSSAAVVGQPRARSAIEFALSMRQPGYHLFVSGAPGSGRRTLVREAVAAWTAQHPVQRFDWVYVHHFAEPHKPLALQLPPGRGARLRADMKALVDDLRAALPAAFDSEAHAAEIERLGNEYQERANRALGEVGEAARERGLVMVRTPMGFTFAPRQGDEVMPQEAFEALPEEERARIRAAVAELEERLARVLRATVRLRREHAQRVRSLHREVALAAVGQTIDETRQRYADLPAVQAYLDAVRDDVVEHADEFRTHEDDDAESRHGEIARYTINVLVDAAGGDQSALVEADLPSCANLVGRVDHLAQLGTLISDFRLIRAGFLHRANGGCLMIDAVQLLTQPLAWSALKRALQRREVRIESMAEMLSLISTVQLEPQPIPLDVKVVLVGDREVCELLQQVDDDFDRLFRVVADLDDDLPRLPEHQQALARGFVEAMRARKLRAPSPAALARLIDHGARRAGDATRITAQVQQLLDVLVEADHHAGQAARERIEAEDVAAAVASRRERASRADRRLRDAMLRQLLSIATEGQRVGQVNGLMVYTAGGETFGAPVRITATTRVGEGQVVDVQRETQLAGRVHAKGVLILSSFLAARYSRLQPHSIVGSLVFEQTYGIVEGDSASLAELVCLLSSIADVPLRQSVAVTGSVDQYGNVLAVGAVNEKVEGFFDLCAARGLDGSHAVILPESNVSHLMLREDIVEAVRAGRFTLHAVRDVDAAIEILTGLSAGDVNAPGDDTVNGRIAKRLHEYSMIRRGEPLYLHRRAPRVTRIVSGEGGG